MTALSFARMPGASRPRPSPARVRRLRTGGEAAGLVGIASPLALIGLLNMALALTDVVMIGRHDPAGLAAIMVVSDLYSIIFNFTAGFAAVVVPHVAAALGAGVPWQVCTIVQRVVLLVCLVAALGVAAIWHAGALVAAIGVHLDAPEVTGAYARYMAGAYLFMVLFAFGRHALSAVARARVAVLAVAAALPLNVLANHVCMSGAFGWPGLGAAGAGLASLVVAMLMGGSVVGFLFLSRSFDGYRALPAMPPMLQTRELVRLARPAALMGIAGIAETGGFLASTLIVGIVAAESLLAHSLAFRAMGTCYLVLAALGQAVTLRIAYLEGRGDRRRKGHAGRAISGCGLALMLGLAGLFVFANESIACLAVASIGESDAALIARTAALAPFAGLALAAAVPAHVVCAWLRAQGRTAEPLALLGAGHWGIGLVSMLLLARAGFGAEGIWLGLGLGAAAASAFGLIRVRNTPQALRRSHSALFEAGWRERRSS